MEEINTIKIEIESARERYKPRLIKYLLVAEAPPDSLSRFFYYPDVFIHDYLFMGVAKALYPDMKEKHLESRRRKSGTIKRQILEKLKEEGFFLLDLSDLPLSLLNETLESQVPILIGKIKKLDLNDLKIILIKSSVYDAAYYELIKAGVGNVINRRITFPSSGGQTKFHNEFVAALKEAKYF